MKTYINGQLEGTNPSAPPGPIDNYAGGNLRIGLNKASDPAWFQGAIDDVRIYNRALSADEVQQLYNIQAGHDGAARIGGMDAPKTSKVEQWNFIF